MKVESTSVPIRTIIESSSDKYVRNRKKDYSCHLSLTPSAQGDKKEIPFLHKDG
jgi:hypothetical protein